MIKRGTDSRYSNKKGQVTLFIILGIILLISISLFLILRSETLKTTTPVIPIIQEVSQEAAPIRIYTERCMEDLTEDALRKLGSQGGYIDLDQFGIITSSINPTEADGLQFSPNSELKVPYWWYMKAENDCTNCLFSSQRPNLKRTTGTRSDNAIESQIDWYIVDKLPACLNNFTQFLDQGYTIETKGDISPITIIAENDVAVYVEYPIELSINGIDSEVSQFYISFPFKLNRFYNFATDITNSQINHSFLERQTLNLIVDFADLNQNSLPPTSETTFEFGTGEIWSEYSVKTNLEQMIATYTPGLQVFNTLNYERLDFSGDDLTQSIYDHMVLPLNENGDYSDYEVTFDYLGWWPIYFDAGEGGLIKPESIASTPFIPLFGIQRYMTTYDVSYPVLVKIRDPDAFNGEGYTFMFALEANIRNNRAIDESFKGLSGIHVFQESLFCNENQRNSGNVSINIIDASSKEPLEDMQISYTCGEETCHLGSTDSNGKFNSQFPICFNGFISLDKQDYFTPSESITTELEKEINLNNIKSYPFVNKEFKVVSWNYSSKNNTLSKSTYDLKDTEQAVITLQRVGDDESELPVVASSEYWGNYTKNPTLKLVPGLYKVRIDLFLHEQVIIPEDKRKEGGFLGIGEAEYTIPEIVFEDNFLRGGAELGDLTGYISIGEGQLYKNNTLVFYVISHPLPKVAEDMDAISNTDKLSGVFREALEPIYI